MIEFEDMIYSLQLPQDIWNATNAEEPYEPVLPMRGFKDICRLYNVTTDDQYKDYLKDCNEKKPYDCPVPIE